MSAYPAQPPPLPTPQPVAAPVPGFAPALPPPLPRPVLPYYDHYAPPPALGNWLAITVCALSAVFLAGTVAFHAALSMPGGAPTASDLILGCAVFPMLLILGFCLFCTSVAAAICTPGRARILAILAVALTAAGFVLAFSQT